MTRSRALARGSFVGLGLLLLGSPACAGDARSTADATTHAPPEGDTGGEDDGSDSEAAPTDRFDVGEGQGSGDDGTGESGCQKADFLFLVDDSGSMADEQLQLISSFPKFISTIQDTVDAQDYHVMVSTTGEGPYPDFVACGVQECFCHPEPYCCYALCGGDIPNIDVPSTCAGVPCDQWKYASECDTQLGAGKNVDEFYQPCAFVGGQHYISDQEPDIPGAFECAARRGSNGDDFERVMESLGNAVGPHAEPGGCNEGFLRDDAILVVVFMTDEEDLDSPGDPATWRQALVDAKHGNESAIVVLGLLGDPDLPNGLCTLKTENGIAGADAAPRLRTFVESFGHGAWASVCEPDYSPFFQNAVVDIDTTCEDFVPPG